MNRNVTILGFFILVILIWQSASSQTWSELLAKADSLSNVAEYDSAILVGKTALEKAETRFGKEDTTVAAVLYALGAYHHKKRNFVEAESLYNMAQSTWERKVGAEYSAVANAQHQLAKLHLDQDRYKESIPFCKKSLTIKEKIYGAHSLELVNTLDLLAEVHFNLDNSVEAEPLLKKSLDIRTKNLGADHPDVATNLSRLASVYMNLERYKEALPLLVRSLEIRERKFGLVHPEVAAGLMALGNYYMGLDNYEKVEPLYSRALSIKEKTLGPEHIQMGALYHNYATLCKKIKRYNDAEKYFLKGLSNFFKNRGPKHRYVSISMTELAEIYTFQERYAEAESLYRQALDNLQSTLGMDHYNTLLCLESLSGHYRLRKEAEKSLALAWQDFERRRENYFKISLLLSEKQALDYSERIKWSRNNYLSCYLDARPQQKDEIRRACEVVFSSKGPVTDGMFERYKSMVSEKDSATLSLAEALRLTKAQLSELFVKGPDPENPEEYKATWDSLTKLTEQWESDLARRSASFRKNLEAQEVSADKITSFLPEKAILVEYIQFEYLKLKPISVISNYLAIVVTQDGESDILNLGEASLIDGLIAESRQHLTRVAANKSLLTENSTEEYKKLTKKIYQKVWAPLEKYIQNKEFVFIAPDGGLNLISFASLADNHGVYLIEEYQIHYLSSGRDLIRLQDQPTTSKGLLALGDPDYNAKPSYRLEEVASTTQTQPISPGMLATRNVRSGCDELKDIILERLPGTRVEVDKVAKYWNLNKPEKAETFSGSQASEEIFKLKAPGKEIIHLATHGYFLQGRCEPNGKKKSSNLEESLVGENPLLLSGLFLAGANLHGEGSDTANAEDGILTADEVSAMNLEGTQMVVLSACETGLGEVKQGEGVYGLRRAFQMAGARTVISALWKVPDLITAETMGELYKQQSKNIPERLRDMQLNQIKKLRKNGDPDHPYSWGAFIALGDWRY